MFWWGPPDCGVEGGDISGLMEPVSFESRLFENLRGILRQ